MWSMWWIWAVAAAGFLTLEVIAPTHIFLGFAIGAAAVSGGLALGVPGLAGSIPIMALVFAVVSLIGWIVTRQLVGVREGQVKVWDRDINDD